MAGFMVLMSATYACGQCAVPARIKPSTVVSKAPPKAICKKADENYTAGPFGGYFVGSALSHATYDKGGFTAGGMYGWLTGTRGWSAFKEPGLAFELGVIGPIQNERPVDGIFTFNMEPTFVTNRARYGRTFLTAGYSRLFITGNAVDFGGGLDLHYSQKSARFLRVSVRDYYTFADRQQNNVTLRIDFLKFLAD